jgi:hypothetical protein
MRPTELPRLDWSRSCFDGASSWRVCSVIHSQLHHLLLANSTQGRVRALQKRQRLRFATTELTNEAKLALDAESRRIDFLCVTVCERNNQHTIGLPDEPRISLSCRDQFHPSVQRQRSPTYRSNVTRTPWSRITVQDWLVISH